MFYLLGLAIFLFSVGWSILLLGGDLFNFVDIPAFIMLIIPLAAILTATQNFKVFAAGFKAAVLPKSAVSEDMRGKAASLFRFLSKATAMIMVVGVMVAFKNLLYGLDFTDTNAIGRLGINIAAALTIVLYGLILIAAVFEPIVIILKKRGDKDRK